MNMVKGLWILMMLFIATSPTHSQNIDQAMDSKNKNFLCEIETGVCAPNEEASIEEIDLSVLQKVEMFYYTDPICSSCWAVEPELKKFKLEYGDYVDISYRMGGLLPGWDGFADKANGIGKPSDVWHHWDEVGEATGMSIDGDVWMEDPLDSSFPPSIAYKAVQLQDKAMAIDYLRKIREMVFLEKKNITREEHLIEGVRLVGGDVDRFKKDYHDPKTAQLFQEEMQGGRQMGVRGFPTFIFVGKDGKGFRLSGMSGYDNYVKALEQAHGKKLSPKPIQMTEIDLIKKYGYLATREISFILSQTDETTDKNLQESVLSGDIIKEVHKYGNFWKWRSFK